MKHNLQTRPKIEFQIVRKNQKEAKAMDNFLEWFKGLEEELQQLFERLEAEIITIHCGELQEICDHLVSKAKDEILGVKQ